MAKAKQNQKVARHERGLIIKKPPMMGPGKKKKRWT
jgi:hypothetical protein